MFLHTNYKLLEKRKSLIHEINKNNTILGNKFNKGKKNLYTENCKTSIKEIEEDTNNWKYISCSWNG